MFDFTFLNRKVCTNKTTSLRAGSKVSREETKKWSHISKLVALHKFNEAVFQYHRFYPAVLFPPSVDFTLLPSLKLCFFLTDKLLIALQITPIPQCLPRNQEAQMCALDAGEQCTQRRRLLEEAM